MYQAALGDVSLRPGPYVAKWGPRVGLRAARLQWFARAIALIGGTSGLLLGLAALAAGSASSKTWAVDLGSILLGMGAVAAFVGMGCLYASVGFMSQFFHKHLTLRNSPLLRDDQFNEWLNRNGLTGD